MKRRPAPRGAARPAQVDACAERSERERPVRRRIGMREAAADRAAVAHRRGRRCRRRPAQHLAAGEPRASSIRACVTPAPIRHAVADVLDLLQRSSRATSTSSLGRARRRFSIGPSDWPPARSLAPPAMRRAPQRLREVPAGRSRTRRPSVRPPAGTRLRAFDRLEQAARRQRRLVSAPRRAARSASLTALKITAGGAIAPPSPMPLMPNSV